MLVSMGDIMKKIIFILILLILVCSVSSCGYFDREKNYKPAPEDYIEWDGNYFYYANFRCSSNLTAEEPYLTEITYNEKTYAIDGVNHWAFKDGKLHMTFYFEVDLNALASEQKTERCSAYTIYSLENKEVEYLYIYEHNGSSYEIDLNKILDIRDDYAIISGTGKITKIYINSDEIETVYCDSYEVKSDYAVIKRDNGLFASPIENFEFKKIMDLSNVSPQLLYYIHNVNDKPFLQIIDQSSSFVNGQFINTSSLTYYDFENETFYELVKFEDNKFLSLDPSTNNMFILGEPKLKEYNPYTPGYEHLEYKLFVDNNVLYTVEFNESEGIKLKELHYFESLNNDEEYTVYKIEGDIIYIRKRYFNKPPDYMRYNRIDTSIVYFDVKKLTFIDKKDHDYDSKIIIAEYDNVIYYVKTKEELAFFAESTFHRYFYRLDKITNQEGLLQYNSYAIECPMFYKYIIDNEKYDFDVLVGNS
jgi:hypothetical protein